MADFDLDELAKFLVKAKTHTYAADRAEVESERHGFKELEFSDGLWNYRDSYAGFYFAPGQEVVRLSGNPIWVMSYAGGMLPKHHHKREFSKQTFTFLKKALQNVEESRPFRGPENFVDGEWEYKDSSSGNLSLFKGQESILYSGKEVFRQMYIGGIVIPK